MAYAAFGLACLGTVFSETWEQDMFVHYPLDQNAEDAGPNQLDGILIGASGTSNRFGEAIQALHFDGALDYLDMGSRLAWSFGTNDFTLSFWMRPTDIAPRKLGIISLLRRDSDVDLCVGYGNTWAHPESQGDVIGLGLNYFASPPWPVDEIGNTSLSDGQWHHIALVRNHDTWNLHVDGDVTPEISIHYEMFITNNTLLIGTEIVTDRYFSGDLDDVRIYSRALPPETIALLADRTAMDLAVEIVWFAHSGTVYQVQWTDMLQTNVWHDLGSPVSGKGSTTNTFDSTRHHPERYYRITTP